MLIDSLITLSLLVMPRPSSASTTCYSVIGVLVIVDVVQGRYQKRLLASHQHG